jgi:hypothetical protein
MIMAGGLQILKELAEKTVIAVVDLGRPE